MGDAVSTSARPPSTRYTRAAVVCVRDGQLLGFFGEDPSDGARRFFPPGGKPERGESLLDTAKRETHEETGHLVHPLAHTEIEVDYEILWNNSPWACTTHFFAALHVERPATSVADADYHRGVAWIPLAQLDHHLRYCIEVLDVVDRLVTQLRSERRIPAATDAEAMARCTHAFEGDARVARVVVDQYLTRSPDGLIETQPRQVHRRLVESSVPNDHHEVLRWLARVASS